MSEALSRRGALGALASVPALAILPAAPAPDLRLDDDPILAAIERHQAAERAFTATLNPVDEVYAAQHGREVTQADTDAFVAAGAEEEAAIEALLETVPLTLLGVRCALAYLAEIQDAYHLADFIPTLLESPVFDGEFADV